MPAPIITGLVNFISSQFAVTVWDGEIPRYDPSGNPINPDAIAVTPTVWPIVKVSMNESGFEREWTTEDPYTDKGEILINVWNTSRASAEAAMNNIEALLARASNWSNIQLGGDPSNPNYIIHLLLSRWYSGQEEGVRTSKSELLYRCDLHYEAMLHGAVATA